MSHRMEQRKAPSRLHRVVIQTGITLIAATMMLLIVYILLFKRLLV
mgnify:CR=1 FL=1